MAFLERFKGKTSNMSKGGIISTVTTASVPVIKRIDNSKAHSYSSSLEDPNFASPQPRFPQYNKRPSVEDELIDSTPSHKSYNPKFARSQFEEQPPSHLLSRAPTDSFIYDRRAHTGQYNSNYAHSPNHKELINTYTGPRGESNFTKAHIDYSATMPHKFGNYGPNSVRNNGEYSSGKQLKAFFNQYPQEPHSAGLKDRSNYSGSPRRDNYEEPQAHEARLSKFSFVERQNNMISKYKMREGREEERSHKHSGMSYSPEKASKLVFFK